METEENSSEQFIRSLKVTGGFETPTGYFEALEDKLAEADAPIFGSTHADAFAVPDGYFERLESSILYKTVKHEASIIPLHRNRFFKIATGIAAAMVLGSMLFFYNRPHKLSGNSGIAAAGPTDEEIISYLDKEGYHLGLLCDAGWCNEIGNINKKDPNEIENYLLEHNDQDLLIDEL